MTHGGKPHPLPPTISLIDRHWYFLNNKTVPWLCNKLVSISYYHLLSMNTFHRYPEWQSYITQSHVDWPWSSVTWLDKSIFFFIVIVLLTCIISFGAIYMISFDFENETVELRGGVSYATSCTHYVNSSLYFMVRENWEKITLGGGSYEHLTGTIQWSQMLWALLGFFFIHNVLL